MILIIVAMTGVGIIGKINGIAPGMNNKKNGIIMKTNGKKPGIL